MKKLPSKTLCCGVLIFAGLLLAFSVTARQKITQQQAAAICKGKQNNATDECCRQHNNCGSDAGGAWLKPCTEYGSGVYDACMRKYGFAELRPTGGPTNALPPNPTATPRKLPVLGTKPVINKGPISSPTPTPQQTIYVKSKSTPSATPNRQLPSHHHHH